MSADGVAHRVMHAALRSGDRDAIGRAAAAAADDDDLRSVLPSLVGVAWRGRSRLLADALGRVAGDANLAARVLLAVPASRQRRRRAACSVAEYSRASLPDRVAYVLGELEGDGPARLLSAPILHREISFIVAGAVNDLDLPADARDTLFANAVRYGYAQDLYANIRRSDTAAALISWLCDHAQHDVRRRVPRHARTDVSRVQQASSSGTLFQLASLSELDARRVRRVACRHMHLADVVLRVSCDIVGDEHVYLASILTDRSHPTVVAMRGDPGLLARVLPAIRERLQTADANIALRLVLQVLATVPIDLDRDLVAAAASANASCDEALCFMLACPQAPVSLGNCPRSLLFQRVTLFALVDERDELGKALSDAVSITVRPLASQIDAVYGALVATESSSGSLCAFSHPSLFHYALLHRKVSPTAHPRELRHFIVQTLPGVALPVHPVRGVTDDVWRLER